MNSSNGKISNSERIKNLNKFLKENFPKISKMFNPSNYDDTRTKINTLLLKQFRDKHPWAV